MLLAQLWAACSAADEHGPLARGSVGPCATRERFGCATLRSSLNQWCPLSAHVLTPFVLAETPSSPSPICARCSRSHSLSWLWLRPDCARRLLTFAHPRSRALRRARVIGVCHNHLHLWYVVGKLMLRSYNMNRTGRYGADLETRDGRVAAQRSCELSYAQPVVRHRAQLSEPHPLPLALHVLIPWVERGGRERRAVVAGYDHVRLVRVDERLRRAAQVHVLGLAGHGKRRLGRRARRAG